MKLELDLHEKYAEKLELAEAIDPTVRDRLIATLESQAMERIIEVSAQADQAQQQATVQAVGEMEADADD